MTNESEKTTMKFNTGAHEELKEIISNVDTSLEKIQHIIKEVSTETTTSIQEKISFIETNIKGQIKRSQYLIVSSVILLLITTGNLFLISSIIYNSNEIIQQTKQDLTLFRDYENQELTKNEKRDSEFYKKFDEISAAELQRDQNYYKLLMKKTFKDRRIFKFFLIKSMFF